MPDTRHVDLVVTGAGELLTCAEDAGDLIGRVPDGGAAIRDGAIVAVGEVSSFTADRVIDAAGGVIMPGFVDAHTHVVFGGSRVAEYAAGVAGREPPAGAPVGIWGTVEQTRAANEQQLVTDASQRLAEMLDYGTTTVESKSGYGLQPDAELRLLRANKRLHQDLDLDVVSTYLGAHAFPPELSPARYVNQVVDLIPQVAELALAEFCDVYCDDGYFNIDQTRRILEAGVEAGLPPKLHLDAYSHTGAARLAAELGAVSVDHLNFTATEELVLLGESGTVAVYVPCLDYSVRHPHPMNPRAVAAAGVELALATDMCPGCWVTSMQLAVGMACRAGGLSPAQALRAATYGAAKALGREDRVGSVAIGKRADLIVLDVPSHEHIAYRLGRNSVTTVVKDGRVVKGPAHE